MIQASAWEERQRLSAEALVAIHDTTKLLNDDERSRIVQGRSATPSTDAIEEIQERGRVSTWYPWLSVARALISRKSSP